MLPSRMLGWVALLVVAAGPAWAQGSNPYASLREIQDRLQDSTSQISEAEAEAFASGAASAVEALAGTPGESGGMPNPVAAYYRGMRIANLLYHGHGWGSFARTLVGNVQSTVGSSLPTISTSLARATSNLSGVQDGVRLDQQAPDGSTSSPLVDMSKSHCGNAVPEIKLIQAAEQALSGAGTEGGVLKVDGVYCDLADAPGIWRVVNTITWTYIDPNGNKSSQSQTSALLIDTRSYTAVGSVYFTPGGS